MLECIITNCIHLLLFLFISLIPFSNNDLLLLLYVISIPNLLLHWITHSNACSIVLFEKLIRKILVIDENCLSSYIIDPLYNIHEHYNKNINYIYFSVILLWLFVIFKIYRRRLL